MASFLGLCRTPATPPPSASVYTPIVTLTSAQDVYPPVGEIDFDPLTLSTDTWRFQVATDLAFTTLVINATGVVGTGAVSVPGMSSILTGKHYLRARTERGAEFSAWTDIFVHGDAVAPTITSSASISLMEGLPLLHTITTDKPGEVTLLLFGGADVGDFEKVGADGIRFFANGVKDYEIPDDTGSNNQYDLNIRVVDLANNFTVQPITVTITDNVADNPLNTEWTSITGTGKSAYALITGTPKLNYAGTGGVGATMLVRAKAAAVNALFQYEVTITGNITGNTLYIGVDNGVTNLNPFGLPGYSDLLGVTFVVSPGEHFVYHGGLQDYGAGGNIAVGDVFTVVVDKVAGTVKLFQTRAAVTTQIGATVTIAAPYTDYSAIAGTNGDLTLTANFGQNAFARALDSGYGAY